MLCCSQSSAIRYPSDRKESKEYHQRQQRKEKMKVDDFTEAMILETG